MPRVHAGSLAPRAARKTAVTTGEYKKLLELLKGCRWKGTRHRAEVDRWGFLVIKLDSDVLKEGLLYDYIKEVFKGIPHTVVVVNS